MNKNNILRIQSNEDFIDINVGQTKYDLELEAQMVMSHVYWDNYHDFLRAKLKESPFQLDNIQQFLQRMREQNLLSLTFPNISFLAAQTISRDMLSYSLIPQHLNALDLSNYFPYSPAFICTQDGQKISFNDTSIQTKGLKPIKVDKKEYKIVRILSENDNLFIDLKMRGFGEVGLIKEVLSLPFFWRNYHLVSRTRVVENSQDNIDSNLNNLIFKYYNPSNDYLTEPRSYSQKISYEKEHSARWRQITSINHFNFKQLASDLIFIYPGHFFPLTNRESRWSFMETPDYTIRVNNKEANLINMKLNGEHKPEDVHNFFVNCIEKIQIDDKDTTIKLSQGKPHGNGQYILTNDGSIIYVYEQNILDVFQMLSVYDNKNNTLE